MKTGPPKGIHPNWKNDLGITTTTDLFDVETTLATGSSPHAALTTTLLPAADAA